MFYTRCYVALIQMKIRKILIQIHLTEWHLIPFKHAEGGFTWLFFDIITY
jgi:hypothetical protein